VTGATGRYTHGHHESVLRSHRWRTAENSCAYLLPHLRPGMSLLDVGCGPGTITADLARRLGGDVLGIDPAAAVIEEARRDFPEVRFEVADLFGLEGTWDVVHAHQVLQHLGDPVAALRAMGTLARSLVAARDSDYRAFVWTGGDSRLDRWLEVYLAVTAANGANADAGRHLLRWAGEAGLHDAAYTTSAWTFATPETRAWWGGLWADRATSSAFAEQAVAYGIAASEDLAEIADGWRAWAARPDSTFVAVHGEVVARPPA
jgi:SAM-dependent methyltransferase